VSRGRPGTSTLLWFGGVALLACALLAGFLLPLGAWIRALELWFRDLGPLGVVVFGLAYVVGTVVFAPGVAMSILAGLVFGWWGIPIVLVSASIGTSLAFLIARYLARDAVARRLEGRPRLQAVDKAVDEEGWKVVALVRLSPAVPFGLQNYFFGLTSVGFWPYAAATLFGIVPGTALYVSLGALGQGSATGASAGVAGWLLFGVGALATVAVTVLVGRKVKAKLRDRAPDANSSSLPAG
jgi:uncharacterized membrane protein YdjX (TVP38/TMEM64 family)